MSEENSAASSAIWALALIIIVALILGALFYGGFLSGKKKTEIDVNINVPSR